jgi:type I restriction enzyme M protein
VNNKGAVSSGNYLWISYFYSYLNKKGRAGFVMSSQASSAGNIERDVRQALIKTGHVDGLISIRSNFFYTRSVPCELWFFDKGKPAAMRDKILMLDARNVFRKVTRKIYDFAPEQLKNITGIVWLYREQSERFLGLVKEYVAAVCTEGAKIATLLEEFDKTRAGLSAQLKTFLEAVSQSTELEREKAEAFRASVSELEAANNLYEAGRTSLLADVEGYRQKYEADLPASIEAQHAAHDEFESVAEKIKGLIKQVDMLYKLAARAADIAEKELEAKESDDWDTRAVSRWKKEIDAQRRESVEQLKVTVYFHRQSGWLLTRFPEARLADVEGLVKLVDLSELEANDWSLTPGRYVGVAPTEVDDDLDFEETIRGIHLELAGLNEEAVLLAEQIQQNFEELGV